MIEIDKSKITEVCEPCKSVEEGEEIGAQLLKELGDKYKEKKTNKKK